MSSLRPVIWGATFLALGIVSLPSAVAEETTNSAKSTQAVAKMPSPSEEVEKITRNLLDDFIKNKSRYQKAPAEFINEVDQKLSPVIAFESIARGVMGKYAHRATPEQILAFERNFKSSLLNFYGKALLKLDNTKISIEQVDTVSETVINDYKAGRSRQIPVNMKVKTSDRTLTISYSMIFDDGQWKLRNVIIDGINIGIQFRQQFSEAVDKHGKLQYVIDNWLDIMSADNEQLKEKVGKSSS
ncbi:ABC transporter substrate-binding protein [Candidatus Sororendozoicomonas aggregata]|uniref:MlaC/ttg2D family ABC transporter substrate-binding protein n=1 Tax=Candidatus Sororendozoicomonas aggregata TaxID=3073239 RepID=UPI002ED52E85